MADFDFTNACFKTIKEKCKENYPRSDKHLDFEEMITSSDKIDKTKLDEIMEKYSNGMNCDEYIENFMSVIQNRLPKQYNTVSSKKSNADITCNDYDGCYKTLNKKWKEMYTYLMKDIVAIQNHLFYDYKMNIILKQKFIEKKATTDLYDPEIENKLIDFYVKLFNNIKEDIQVIIICIEKIFIILFEHIKNCDQTATSNDINIIKETNICLANTNIEKHYLDTITLLKVILEILNVIFTNNYYDFYKILIIPLFSNILRQIHYLHFNKFIFNFKSNKEYSNIILFFKLQTNMNNRHINLLQEIRNKKQKAGKSKTKRKRLNRKKKNTKSKNRKSNNKS